MNSIQGIAATIAGAGLLTSMLAVPLILGRVRRNAYYGIRNKTSFHSEADWYRMNALGGRYLFLSGIVMLATGIVGFFLPVSFFDWYAAGASAVTLLAVIIPCARLSLMKPSGPS